MFSNIEDYFCSIANSSGLYGLFSVPGLGKRELLMYVSHLIVREKRGIPLVFSLELSAEQWKSEMENYGLAPECVMICDRACPSIETIREEVNKNAPSVILIDHLELIDDKEIICKLKEIAEDYHVPIIVSSHLTRRSGDNDPVYRRPDMIDSLYVYRRLYGGTRTIDSFFDDMGQFNDILLLHRCHDWYRGIGVGHAFNICNEAELKIISDWHSQPYSLYFDYSVIMNNGKAFHQQAL